MIRKNILAALALLAVSTVACDPSKAELDKTKGDLQTVTAERDSLKTQLDQANGKVASLQQQVTDLQAKAAVAAAPAPAEEKPADEKPAKGGKHAAKAKEKADKPAPMPSAAEQKAIQAHPQGQGAAHF